MSELPRGWYKMPLNSIVDILDSKRIPINADERAARIEGKSSSDLYPYYGATGQVGLIDGFLFDEPLILVGEDGVPFLDRQRQKAYKASGKYWVNNHAHVLRPRQELVNDGYLLAYLNAFDYGDSVTGTTRLKLTQAALSRIPVILAPRHEQDRIAAALDKIFERIRSVREKLDRVPEILKRFRKGVLEAAVSGRLTEDWRYEHDPRPQEHRNYPRRDLAELVAEPLRNGRSVRDGVGTSVLRLTAIRNGLIDLDQCKSGDWAGLESGRFLVNNGDFLVSRGNGSKHLMGRGGLVSDADREVAFPDTMIRIRPNLTQLLPAYLRWIWDASEIRAQIEQFAKTTAGIWKISQGDMARIKLPVPSFEEQTEIACRIDTLFLSGAALGRYCQSAAEEVEKLTHAVLEKAFRGGLVPQGRVYVTSDAFQAANLT